MITTAAGVTGLLGGERLVDVVGHDVDEASLVVEPVPYTYGSPATGGLARVRGRRPDGTPFSVFVKVLQHLRHWPVLALLPPAAAERMQAEFPWREELSLWDAGRLARLPAGLFVPHLLGVADLGDDRVAVWMEDVRVADVPWDEARFARAAYRLGEWDARMCDDEVVAACPFPPDYGLRMFVDNGTRETFAALDDDALWDDPVLARSADVRERLRAARTLVEGVFERFAALRHGLPHGDASPQNLLVPAGDPDGLVAIDISYQTPAPLGFDLSQLVVGLGHAGLLDAGRLPAVEAAVIPAFADGVRAAGLPIENAEVAATYAGTLLLRSGFAAVPWDAVGDPGREAELVGRLDLTRVVLDAADRHH